MKVAFELKGEMPLLLHADDVMQSDELKAWRQAPENKNITVPGDDRSPPWTWQTYLYSDGEHIAMPQENLMVALRQAGTQMILKRQKTYKEISQSGLLITSEFCDFFANGKQIPFAEVQAIRDWEFVKQCDWALDHDFRLFVKRARVNQSKHVRCRARFDRWSVKGTIQILAPEITFEVLCKLFELAGRVGLCDWRPGCKTPGPFGMFSSELKKCAERKAA